MRKPISDFLRGIAAGVLILDDTPTDEDIKRRRELLKKLPKDVDVETMNRGQEGEKSEIKISPIRRNVQETPQRDIRKSQRPDIRRPRRQHTFQSEWKGEDVKDKRKEYQQQYRAEHGNN